MRYFVVLLLCVVFFFAGVVAEVSAPISCYGQVHRGANSTCVMDREVQTYFEGREGIKISPGFGWDLGAP